MKVFLCHSSGDKAAVRLLYHRLKSDGADPWLDEEKILPGQEWESEIKKAVRDADAVIVCLSEAAVSKRGFVQKEIKFALDVTDELPEDTIFLIPAKLEDCDVPERLRKWQWVDLFADGGYEKLAQALGINILGERQARSDVRVKIYTAHMGNPGEKLEETEDLGSLKKVLMAEIQNHSDKTIFLESGIGIELRDSTDQVALMHDARGVPLLRHDLQPGQSVNYPIFELYENQVETLKGLGRLYFKNQIEQKYYSEEEVADILGDFIRTAEKGDSGGD